MGKKARNGRELRRSKGIEAMTHPVLVGMLKEAAERHKERAHERGEKHLTSTGSTGYRDQVERAVCWLLHLNDGDFDCIQREGLELSKPFDDHAATLAPGEKPPIGQRKDSVFASAEIPTPAKEVGRRRKTDGRSGHSAGGTSIDCKPGGSVQRNHPAAHSANGHKAPGGVK